LFSEYSNEADDLLDAEYAGKFKQACKELILIEMDDQVVAMWGLVALISHYPK